MSFTVKLERQAAALQQRTLSYGRARSFGGGSGTWPISLQPIALDMTTVVLTDCQSHTLTAPACHTLTSPPPTRHRQPHAGHAHALSRLDWTVRRNLLVLSALAVWTAVVALLNMFYLGLKLYMVFNGKESTSIAISGRHVHKNSAERSPNW